MADSEQLQNTCSAYTQELPPNDHDYTDYPYAETLIWQAIKDGSRHFLYGTIHTQDHFATRFSPQVRRAIIQSQYHLMEIKLSEESNRIFTEAMFYQSDETLDGVLPPELTTLLGQQLSEYGYQPDDAHRIKPWAAFSTIGAPRPVRALSLDQVLMNYAESHGLKVIGIETMDELVVTLSSLDESDQITILKDTICNRSKIIANTKKLVDMHMRDDLLGIVKFNDQPHQDEALFQRYIKTMVHDRNTRMVKRILTYFAEGPSFVAVGALHLPGEHGILKRLEQAGYTITPYK